MKKLLLVVCIVAVSMAGALAFGAPYIFAWWHLREAAEAYRQNDFGRARAQTALALTSRPTSPAAHLLAAQAARRSGDVEEAQRHLDECRRVDARSDELNVEQAMLYAQTGRLAEAESVLAPLLEEEHPDRALIFEALAQGYRERDELEPAVACLNRWLRIEPGAVQALVWRGEALEQLAESDAALDDYHRAVELVPERADARLHLAQLLLRNQSFEEAVVQFERLNEQQPGDAAVAVGLAQCRRQQGRESEAWQLLEAVLLAFPRHPAALAELGKLKLYAGDIRGAEIALRQAFELLPFDREVNYNLGLCLELSGKHADAQKCQDRAQQIKKDVERLSQLMQQIRRKPHDLVPRCEAGKIALRNGQEERAIKFFEGTLREDATYAPAHEALAEIFERRGDAARAAFHREMARKFPQK
jgi:tetratricopeptide (TPR) repeat protein